MSYWRNHKTILLTLPAVLCLLVSVSAQEEQPAPRPKLKTAAEKQKEEAQQPPQDSDADLRAAIQNARGSEQQMVENLEGYLRQYPNSRHRGELERELYKMSSQLRDRNRMIAYAMKLAEADLNDVDMLTALISLLRERRAEGDLTKALSYANQLVEEFENIFARGKPARVSVAQWEDRKARGMASVYLIRGRVQADLHNTEKAAADLQKSFRLSKFSEAAMTLAEMAEQRKTLDEAIDYYVQAFVLSMDEKEGAERDEIRERLGRLYKARNGSETGLGDLLLKAYDARLQEQEARLARLSVPNLNEGVTDAYAFQLTRLDGSVIRLSDYKGKVIVLNFWATWCGPCRYEMPMLEKTMAKYNGDSNVVFLALNTDEDRTLVAPFLKEQKYNLPIAYANYLDEHFGVNSIPTTIIFDPKGNVSYRQAGVPREGDFVAMLSEQIETARKR